ncbi:MAG: hypothetical protein K6G04_04735 [Lachnospiraceae bacterium]|nr:hypothetical protein [Lachnospiraceae bacterium]
MKNRWKNQVFAVCLAGALAAASLSACGSTSTTATTENTVSVEETTAEKEVENTTRTYLTKEDITVNETYESTNDSEHAIEVDGEEATYANIGVTKTGDSDQGDEADFYGDNSAIFSTNGATTTITDSLIETDGTHANAVFSYGEGTVVTIANSVIETNGNCSGGLMTTGGGTMNAENLTILTSGNSSAAIRSDRGGGTVNVTEGYYKTSGTGSPVIYSTADITVSDAYLESTASQAVVVEGQNSVTLNNCEVVGDNNTKNSDHSETYQAVMIYQSMSGDADDGTAAFSMTGGSLENMNGDVFFVTNTQATITLDGVAIANNDTDGVFLRAEAAGWGSEGSNGGQLNLTAKNQTIAGNILVDEVSKLNLYLTDNSSYSGAINPDGAAGEVYVELSDGTTWTLTEDSYITALTCDAGSIQLNGHTLYVNGVAYTEGSASEGSAVEFSQSSGGGMGDGMPGGEMPSGEMPSGEKPSGEKPSGAMQNAPGGDGSEPPAKPGE